MASASLLEFNANMAAVSATAQASGTQAASVAALFNRIATPIRDMGGSAADAQQAVASVAQALRISGASAGESSAAMLQFAQAMGSGVLRGEELNSIMENAPRLAQAIATGLGVTIGELKRLGEQGALTSEQVLKAVRSQQAALADEASRLPQTVGMAWVNLGEAAKKYAADVDKAYGITTAMAGGLNAMAASLPAIVSGLEAVAVVAAVAFAAKSAGAVAGKLAEISATRALAVEEVRRAEGALAGAAAVQRVAAANVEAAATARAYAGASELAALADERRVVTASLLAANHGAATAATALHAAQAASAAASMTLLGRAMAGATAAGRGLMTLLGGPWGVAITAITVGALAWEHFSSKAKKAEGETRESLAKMTKDFKVFAAKMGEQEKSAAIANIQDKLAEARDLLASPKFRNSSEGLKLADEAKQAAEAIDKLTASEQKLLQNRNKERGLFNLDEKGLGGLGFLDKEVSDRLKAFDVLYREFTEKRRADNGKLIASTADVRAALALLFAQAKTSSDFAAIQGQLEKVIASKPLASRATFTSQLENAILLKSDADRKELAALTAGLVDRLRKEGDFLRSAVDQALIKVSSANAIAKVAAELRQDVGGAAAVDRGNADAELVAARTLANQRLAALETVAQREQKLIKERMTATQDQLSTEINGLAGARAERLIALAGQEAEIESKRKSGLVGEAVYRQTVGRITDERLALSDLTKQRQETAQKAAQLESARSTAGIEAARSLARAEAETAVKRRAILEEIQAAYKSKFSEALAAYKQYAEQVIDLDKRIATNRLDTASAINALRRSVQTPQEQEQSIASEMASVQEATEKARKAGQNDQALELLNRQKSLAQQYAGLRGEGVDPQVQTQEAIVATERIGAEIDAIMQKMRAAAAAAAEAAAKQATESAQAMNNLAEQIKALNERAEIRLKPTIDNDSLDAAKTAVQEAFAGLTVPVKVVAAGLPGAPAVAEDAPALAYGGPLPGHAPHDRADNMLYWGTPGEWVIQRPAARYYGAAFMAALNAMRLPKFASGGMLRGSAIDRLGIPGLPSGAAGNAAGGNNLTLDFGELGKYHAQASQNTQRELERVFTRAALARGRR